MADGVASRLPYRDPGLYHVPSFYNNFELVHVPFFRAAAVRAFNEAVAQSNGIWKSVKLDPLPLSHAALLILKKLAQVRLKQLLLTAAGVRAVSSSSEIEATKLLLLTAAGVCAVWHLRGVPVGATSHSLLCKKQHRIAIGVYKLALIP